MADDKNTNQDPEEDQFDDDEDFGLPDLEYEELGDEDDFEDEMEAPEPTEDAGSVPADEEPAIEETPSVEEQVPVTPEPEETPVESKDDSEKDLGGELDFEDIDLSDIDTDMSDEELQKEIEKMEAEGLDVTEESSEPEFYEEESFEEFEEKEDPLTSVFGADDSTDQSESKEADVFGGSQFEDKVVYGGAGNAAERRNFTKIVIIGSVIITIVAVLFIVLYDPEAEMAEEQAVVEEPVREPVVEEPVVADTAAVMEAPVEAPVMETPEPSSGVAGEITKLESQTGKSYVVVASFFDEDLAMDHANELAEQGESPYVIPPFNDYRFYRVAIAEFNSFEEAMGSLAGYQGQFSSEAWALRY